MSTEPTVFLVDDDADTRDALSAQLRSHHLAVETFPSGQALLDHAHPERPGCLVLDLRLPDVTGPALRQRLADRGGTWPVVFITGHADVKTAVAAMRDGAIDFLEKPIDSAALLAAVRTALAHDAARRATVARRAEVAARLDQLTHGERDVLDLMLTGLAYKGIARKLNISYKTVEARRAKLMRKMRCENTTELLRLLLQDGPPVNDQG